MMDKIAFDKSWKFQKHYLPEVEDILREHSYMWVDTRISTKYEDTKEATDVVSINTAIRFAVRIRRWKYLLKYKDLTIRSYSQGYKTELKKIKDGAGDFYLYCWENQTRDGICAYWLIDMSALRDSGLLDRATSRTNNDGTAFITIKEWELKDAGALLVDWSK